MKGDGKPAAREGGGQLSAEKGVSVSEIPWAMTGF
jgi:hypothetical protein